MKDLHHHIFSKTTCITKETMLKQINKQLSKRDLHEVETHLIDCEFCTEAYEGLIQAKNPSLFFVLDNAIDKRVQTKFIQKPFFQHSVLFVHKQRHLFVLCLFCFV